MTDINRKAALERRRLLRILKDLGLPEASWKTLEPIITNVSWMKAKLDEALWKSYISGMQCILKYMPEAEAAGVDTEPRPVTVLELVKGRHSACRRSWTTTG